MDVDSLNKEKKESMKLVSGSDYNGRSRQTRNTPQDEEELDFMIGGWND